MTKNSKTIKVQKTQAKKPTGRPTKYNQKYCKEIVAYFDVDATRIVEDMRRDGSTTEGE